MSQLVLSSLDNKSTTIHRPLNPTYRDYLLQDLKAAYSRAYDYYIGYDSSNFDFSQKRFLTCHNQAVFARNNETGYVRVLARSCHLRFCPICNRAREKLIRRNVTDWLELKKYPKFLTLTLKHSNDDLRAQIDKLYRCFKEFRRLKLVKQRVQSGIWFFQITRGKTGNEWHPHLHCILTGGYLPKTELQKNWMRITGESFMVDIRLIRDVVSAACEVARYAVQACNIKTLNCEEMFTLDCALKRRRICGTWGSARKQRLTQSPKYVSSEWTIVGSWSAVLGCKSNVLAASEIYSAWERGVPLAKDISVDDLDDFVKGIPPPDEIEIETVPCKSRWFD
jgi:hypothetical protein